MKLILSATILLTLLACSHDKQKKSSSSATHIQTIEEAVMSTERTPENVKRDRYRHPVETLTFFGLKNDMTVIEIWPSGGWYTEILAPFLSEKGRYIIADPAADPNGYTKPRVAWLEAHPAVASKVGMTTFIPGGNVKLAEEGSVDMILTFRNVHNWLPRPNQAAAFKTFFNALKSGGVLGVVDHRANPKKKFIEKNGYVLQKDIIKLAEQAGFKLEASSEVNANPLDQTDHKDGVWMLPPRLRVSEKLKEKYMAIGESDRMTLKFVKP